MFAAPLLAQPPRERPPDGPPRRDDDRPRMERRMEEMPPLARPLKIVFRLEPKEEKDKPFWIVTATGRYGVSASYQGGEQAFHIEVDGRARLVGEKILLTYDAELGMKTKDGGGEIGAEGSAQVVPGKEKVLASLGDKSLVVLVTFEDEGN
jgi:hypothetical protein